MSDAQVDELCGFVRKETDASSAIVIVLRGKRGSDYSVCTEDGIAPALVPELPAILRHLAHQLDQEQQDSNETRRVSRR